MVIHLPLSAGEVAGIVISLSPALLFLVAIRTHRGVMLFGPILLIVTAIAWLGMFISTTELAGLSVVFGSFLGLIAMIIGAAVDNSWR